MPGEKRASLPFYSPRIWHGMTAGVWLSLLRENGFAVAPSRWPMSAVISAASIFNSTMRAMSEVVYKRRVAEAEIQHPPLFVLGHWRTGTTLLHELLVQDERFSYPTTYQCFAPHHFLLTNGTVGPIIDLLMPRKRPMDNMQMGHSRPQEDEFALVNLGVKSNYLDWSFPNRDVDYDDFLTLAELSEEQVQEWQREFMWFIRRLTAYDSRRLVLKSPTHTARVATILKVLPDAKFVHIVRNPLSVIPSTIRTWTRMTDSLSLQVRQRDYSMAGRIDVFNRMYERYFEDRSLIPKGNLVEISFEDLVDSPLEKLNSLYESLGLGDFAEAKSGVEAYLDSTRNFQGNKHELSEDIRATIGNGCQRYMEEYGYVIAS